MKNLFGKFSIFVMVLSVAFFTSCEDEPIIDPIGPSISFSSEAGLLDGDAELQAGETFSVKLSLSKGDDDLQAITVYAGGTKLANSDFTIDDGNITTNNPFTVGTGTEFKITITANDVVGDVTTYAFEVSDTKSVSSEVSLAITIAAPLTIPLNVEYTAVVLNNFSGSGFGSLDLDTGAAVSSSDATGDLRDRGIDLGAPSDATNWIQKIHPVNGASMRVPDFTTIENFSFDTVDSREALEAAYDSASDVTETDKLAEGDMFMALVGEDYYLIQVGAIEVKVADNTDNYTLNVKGSKK